MMSNKIKIGSLVSYPSLEEGNGLIRRFGIVRQLSTAIEGDIVVLIMSTDGTTEITNLAACELGHGATND